MNLSNTARHLILAVMVLFFVILGVGLFIFRGDMAGFVGFGISLFLGSSFSCVKVIMMEYSITRSIKAGEGRAAGVVGAGMFMRYIFTAGVIVLAIFVEPLNHWGVIAGVLSLHPASYSSKIFVKDFEDDLPPGM